MGECPRSVSGWCIWTGSRPGPDGVLSVMQLPEGLYMDPSSLVDVIFCGLAILKFFISCRLGFGVWFDWPEGYPRLCLVLCSPGYFCKLLAMFCANLL